MSPDPHAVLWIRALIGPTHRLAWMGDTSEGARARAAALFGERLQDLYASEGQARRLAVLGSTWSALARDVDPLGTAWQVDDHLPEPLGPALRRVLDLRGDEPALHVLWRPVRFARAAAALRDLTAVQPNFRASPAPDLFGEAREAAQQLLAALAEGAEAPPEGNRLLEDDVEEWASEPRGTHQLLRGVKVWNTLVEWMRRMRDAAVELAQSWTSRSLPRAPLPDVADRLEGWFGEHAPLATALLYDLQLDLAGRPPALEPAATLAALQELLADTEPADRAPYIFLADEARWSDPELAEPAWAAEAREHLRRLSSEVEALSDRARRRALVADPEASEQLQEVIDQLGEAAAQLRQHRSREAVEWVVLARATLDQAVADADLADVEARASARWSRLRAAGLLPLTLEDLPAADASAPEVFLGLAARIDELWDAEVARLEPVLKGLAEPAHHLHGDRDRRLARETLELAAAALRAGDLHRARRAADQLRRQIEGAQQALEERLDPGLKQLLHRARRAAFRPVERQGLEVALARVRDRADIGLPSQRTREALTELISAMEQGEHEDLQILVVGVAGGLAPVLWWRSGVPIHPGRYGEALQGLDAVEGKLFLAQRTPSGLSWDKLVSRRERFLPVVKTPRATTESPEVPEHLADWTGHFFLESPDGVHGPWRVEAGQALPADPRGLVASLSSRDFWDLFGGVTIPSFSQPERHVIDAPSLADLVTEGGRLVDQLGEERSLHWLEGLVEAIDPLSPEGVAAAVDLLEAMDLPHGVLETRLARLRPALAACRALSAERTQAVESWLASDASSEARTAGARAWVLERKELLDATVMAERARLRRELVGLTEQHASMQGTLDQLAAEVEAAARIRDDARFALLASWGGASTPPVTARAPLPRAARPAASPLVPVADLRSLATATAQALDVDLPDVANLLLTLATSWWTLLAGPPGVGKSSAVRRLLHRLGHGPETGRCLELVVRRDWQDDAALFGFWHPGEQRWEPSSDGLIEQLMEAAEAHQAGRDGLFAVVLEELNLAAPEYYLARPISSLEDAHPRIRLYGEGLQPRNADRYPSSVPVADNVRWVGTVNIDDTVERLSPRFLSRAAVIRVEPDLDALIDGGPLTWPEPDASSWSDVLRLTDTPPGELGALTQVVRFLHERRMPGAPSPRALQQVRRYLGAADGVLGSQDALDFQTMQRLLPGLRGVGERYRSVLDDLAALLERLQLRRSARRVTEVRERGEEMGDFYDCFHG